MADRFTELELAGQRVRLSNPDKVYFPEPDYTKLDLANYYIATAEQTLRHLRERPTVLKRFTGGIKVKPFYQKRVPKQRPEWLETTVITFPSGRTAEELVPNDIAHLIWAVSLGNIDFNPHLVRRADLEHPDELRIDLDPVGETPWKTVREVCLTVGDVLKEHGLIGYPKTSGSRGMHVLVRVSPKWDFQLCRRAALALAREVERREPQKATTSWWREERPPGTVFIDYNQNAKDRTVASAYSVRLVVDGRVSCPLSWDEVSDCDPAEFTLATVPERVRRIGDPSAEIDSTVGSLSSLLELADRDEHDRNLSDAPWPPHFRKQKGETPRVQPSRRRKKE